MDNMTKKGADSQRTRQGKRHWSAMDTVILVLVLLAIGGLIFRVVDLSRQSLESGRLSLAMALRLQE